MNVMTPVFRVSYPNVFKARRNDLSGKDEFSLVALFPKGCDLTALKQAALKTIEEKWGADKSKHPKNIRSPFRDQGERKTEKGMPAGYEEGAIFLNLKSAQRPGLVNAKVEDIIDESEFYAGCWARATVSVYAYDQAGNRGVAFGLGNIQKVKDGDSLSGRPTPQSDFAAVEETATEGKDSTSLFS